MSPPRKIRRTWSEEVTPQGNPDGVITLEIGNFSDFKIKSSPIVEIYGIPWKLFVQAKVHPPFVSKSFTMIICCNVGCESTLWECNIDCKFSIINRNRTGLGTIDHKTSMTLSKNESSRGISFHYLWSTLMDPNKLFIHNNKVIVEIGIYVKNFVGMVFKPCFDFSSSENCSDVILIIEGKKIYVNKQYLAVCSDFFHALFFGDFAEKKKEEIELKDVVYEEFIELLNVIYPSRKRITDDSAAFLLKLGDRFQIVSLVDRVERFLYKHSAIPKSDLEILGSAYNLHRLKPISPSRTLIDDNIQYNDFSSSDTHSNTVLIIQGKAVHVNKQYLAIYSLEFQKLFFASSTKAQKEFKLDDLIVEEFIELLRVIYPSSKKITDGSAEFLLKLAQRFNIACVIERVETYLKTSLTVPIAEKLLLAEQFRLVRLQEHCFSSLTTRNDFKDVKNSPFYTKLSDATKITLFELIVKRE